MTLARRVSLFGQVICGLLVISFAPQACARTFPEVPIPAHELRMAEVIVKFVPDSSYSDLLRKASSDPGEAYTRLADAINGLGRQVGIPLALKQITSGQEVVLSVQLRLMSSDLASRLRAKQKLVKTVNLRQEGQGILSPGTPVAEVYFHPGSEPESTVSKLPAAAAKRDALLEELIADLTAGYGFKLNGQISPDGQLLIKVDVTAVTLELVERLKKHRDVEYAQPNLILRPTLR